MMTTLSRQSRAALCCGLLFALFLPGRAAAQHAHINAGALGLNQNDALYFVNGASFVSNSLYAQPLNFTNAGFYANFFQGGITFTALPATPQAGGPSPGHAAIGSQLRLRFVSCAGPLGGRFGVWDVDGFNWDENPAESLTFSLPVGLTNGTNSILLSENLGEAEADPFGHIHGRRFTATLPGLYTLGLQIYDAASNGAGGGPIHAPSEIFYLHFQAGLVPSDTRLSATSFRTMVGTQNGRSYRLEATSNLTNGWTTVQGPVSGDQHLKIFTELNVTNSQRFYRLRETIP